MFAGAVRGFATLAEVKLRMRSVAAIQKITKSMKMVAASKLRAVQTNLENARPYNASTETVFEDFKKIAAEKEKENPAKKVLLVALTSDRGLCGAINSGVVKLVKNEARRLEESGKAVELVVVGEKGRAGLVREKRERIIATVTELGKTPVTFTETSLLAEKFANSDVDKIVVFYNRFKSAIAYVPMSTEIPGKKNLSELISTINAKYQFDSDCLVDLYEYHLSTVLFGSMLENATSEQSSRMTAMGNASTNASDMLGRLRLKYNRTRQAVITRELIEIISGADAVGQ